MKIRQDYNHSFNTVEDYVLYNTESVEGGQIESLETKAEKTAEMLARLLKTLVEKNAITPSELVEIVGGYPGHAQTDRAESPESRDSEPS